MITWDPNKDRINTKKHQLPFDTAQHVFDDPLRRTSDAYEENGEWRYDTVGFLFGQVIVIVSHTIDYINNEERIKIISARKADKKERKSYENDPAYP